MKTAMNMMKPYLHEAVSICYRFGEAFLSCTDLGIDQYFHL